MKKNISLVVACIYSCLPVLFSLLSVSFTSHYKDAEAFGFCRSVRDLFVSIVKNPHSFQERGLPAFY
jgi:hypothetical protein